MLHNHVARVRLPAPQLWSGWVCHAHLSTWWVWAYYSFARKHSQPASADDASVIWAHHNPTTSLRPDDVVWASQLAWRTLDLHYLDLPSPAAQLSMMQEYDMDGDNTIDWQEFRWSHGQGKGRIHSMMVERGWAGSAPEGCSCLCNL